VRNLGPSIASYSPANPLRITDTLSADETFVALNPATPDWSCSVAGVVVTCETTGTGTIAVGSEIELRLTTVAGAGTDSNITNTACTDSTAGSAHTPSANSPTGNDCRSRTVRSTTSAADLSVQKDVSLSPTGGFTENLTIPDTSDVFYIRLRVSSAAGSDLARTVRVRDTLPNFITETGFNTGVTLESTTKGSLVYTSNNGRAQWNLTDLDAGETETMVIRVERPFESGSFVNSATVFSVDTTETNNSDNTDTAAYTVVPIADMTVNSKSVTPNPVQVGVPATYLISVRNDGANPASNVVVTDVIDPAFFEIIGTPTTTKTGASCSVAAATGTVSCTMGEFIRTEVRQISVEVLPKYPFGGTLLGGFPVSYTNRATVESDTFDSDGGTDPNAGNNFFDLPHDVDGPAFDIGVSKAESNPATDDPIRFDETLNYDIRASNFGPSRATDVLVLDIPAPPAGLTMTLASVSINPAGANGGLSLQAAPNAGCVQVGANVECRVDQSNSAGNFLDPGNQVIFRVSFTIGGTAPSTIQTFSNEVQITSAEQPVWNGAGADGETANNQAVQTTTVLPATDLEILSKSSIGGPDFDVNEPIPYTIRFRNNGPSSSTSVRIIDVLPAGFNFTLTPPPGAVPTSGSTATISNVSCSGLTTITCNLLGNFPAGAGDTVDLTIGARAVVPYTGDTAPTSVTNTVSIEPGVDQFGDPLAEDPNSSNNDATADVQIVTSSISGSSYADDNDNGSFEAGEGMGAVTITLTGTDAFGNAINLSTMTDASGNFTFENLPPANSSGYTLVETQPSTHYDLAETAGNIGGVVDNSSFGDAPAQNTIRAIVLNAGVDATGYLFQNHTNAVIDAQDDNPAPVNGATGANDIINALDNDTINGVPATIANVDITIVNPATPIGGGPVPVLDPATGLVDVPAGTPAGSYEIDYEICDEEDPTTCAPATITVVVTAGPILAVNDSETGVNGLDGETNVLNVLDGDSLNGSPADITTVDITVATGSSVPAGLTFDPATGQVDVDPGTPAGTYSFDYTICETLNPSNCSTATASVTVDAAPIQAVNDSETGVNGASGEMNVLNVLDGDTLNGAPVTAASVDITVATGSSVPAGLTFDPATGQIDVDPGTPAGTYSFDYTICETINPMNCSTATATVTVDPAPIQAVNDSETGVNGLVGESNVLNVLDGDTLNGAPADIADVDITVATGSSVPAGLTFNPATGQIDVDPGTPAGTYSFDYTICETINPMNCSTATATVTVDPAPIQAVNDSAGGVNGAMGASDVLNVLTDDTLNGNPVDITDVTIAVATGSSVPAGLTFDPLTGNVSVDAGTPSGPYSFDYTICERLNPSNCSTATATVTVVNGPITADDDSTTPVNGSSGANGVIDALDGDTLNSAPATLGTVDITVINPATPINGGNVPVLDPATGLVNVPAGTPAGTYTIDYQICEELNPTNCATAQITVPVVAGTIAAVDESVSGIDGNTGANNVLNALAGDTLDGNPVSTANVTIALAPGATLPSGITFDTATGNVGVAPGTPAGTYMFDYQICETINPTNCATATDTITVIAAPIVAVNDTETGVNGATGAPNILNVLDGDTLSGAAIDPADVTITLAAGSAVPAGLTFDPATGNVSVDPGTLAGDYTFDYTICEVLNPTNCSTATVLVTVDLNPIEALPDTAAPTNGGTGASGVIDVLANDTLSLNPADTAGVTITVDTPATPINGGPVPVLNPATGLVDVPAGTPAGDYTIEYTICEIANPTNCSTTTVTVPVTAGPIAAENDSASDINGADGADNVLNVLAGDTVNGEPATTDNVTIALAPGSAVPAGLTFDPATGNVSVDPGTPAGEYSFDYQICEVLNPDNCTTAIATVTVIAPEIQAVDDASGEINSADGGTDVVNAFTGDTLNGQPADPSNATVALAPGETLPTGITFDPATGSVSVAPGTPDGTYSFDYVLCERLNPDNCSTATITVNVVPPVSTLSGIVFLDENLNDNFEGTEPLLEGWGVEVSRNGEVVGTAQTDADGFYSIENLLSGDGYTVRFLHPTTGVEFGKIEDAELPINGALVDQNLPIDPSGVIYDAITRAPVPGALVNLVDANGTVLPAVCYIDPSQANQVTGADGYYRFDIVAGAAAQCPAGRSQYTIEVTAPAGYADPESTVIAAEEGVLNVAGLTDPAAIVPNVNAPQVGDPTVYYFSFLIGQGDANVVNNHIPLDPFLSRAELLVTKTSTTRTASRGDLVPYTITVRNTETATRTSVDVVDILPPGFKYVPGSARVNNAASEPITANRELRWNDQTIPGNSSSVYQIVAVIGAGVTDGDRINTAVGRNGLNGADISNRAQAVVSIVPSAIFDCAEIIGKVFEDLDGDGYQDKGEPGVPGARVATVNGQLITTDEYGRYHITCAAVPNAQIGSNFVLKLDTRTIAEGYAPTSDNPQSIRLTRGKISELNFGVQRARTIAIAIKDDAFVSGGEALKSGFAEQLRALTRTEAQRLVIQVTYASEASENGALIEARLASLRRELRAIFDDDWEGPPPAIETNIMRPTAASGGE
jgi:uncharacterized repeat protein (TIGR01451 family)